jgi:type II secretory pathway pseudopilin PulG
MKTPRNPTLKTAGARRGAILLELMLSLALLILGLTVIGTQFTGGLETARRSEIRLRCAQLAELKLAELDAQMFNAAEAAQGEFGPAYPGFKWELVSQPNTAIPDLPTNQQIFNVTLTVTYEAGGTVHTFAVDTIRGGPITFDLAEELGMEKEQLDALASTVPLPSLQTGSLNMAELKDMNPLVLMQMLPQIAQAMGLPNADLFAPLLSDPQKLMDVLSSGQLPEDIQQQLNGLGVDQGMMDNAINDARGGGGR